MARNDGKAAPPLKAPKYDGTLTVTDDGPQPTLGDVLKAFTGMKQWAADFAEYVDGMADVLGACDARLAQYPDVTGLREEVGALRQQLQGLAARVQNPLPGAAILSNGQPAGTVDAFVYHPSKPSRRVRTAYQRDAALKDGFFLELSDAAKKRAKEMNVAEDKAAADILAMGSELDTRRPEPLTPAQGAANRAGSGDAQSAA